MFGLRLRHGARNSAGRVVVFIDYDNIDIGARRLGRVFPVAQLRELGHKYGIARMPKLFFSHHVDRETIMRIGREGFVLRVCPPAKKWAPDTVDKRIHEECSEIADDPHNEIFVIVSTDGDFDETVYMLRDHHKTVVRFKLDEAASALKSDTGDTIELPNEWPAHLVERRPPEGGDFRGLIQRIREGRTDACDEESVKFLALVTNTCDKLAQVNGCKRSFRQWTEAIWSIIRRDAYEFCSDDCREALHALNHEGNIFVRREQLCHPMTYYEFNPLHGLNI